MTYSVSNHDIIFRLFLIVFINVFYMQSLFITLIIVVLILLHLSYCVNVCHVFVCILSVYLSGTTMEISASTFLCHLFI